MGYKFIAESEEECFNAPYVEQVGFTDCYVFEVVPQPLNGVIYQRLFPNLCRPVYEDVPVVSQKVAYLGNFCGTSYEL